MSLVRTVTGDVDADSLGLTLPHEHLYLSMWEAQGSGSMLQLADEAVLLKELEAFRACGGTCLVDQTPRGCGRDPARVKRLAEMSGLAIVMGCGWYTEPYYPPCDDLPRRPVESIAGQLLAEIHDGLDGTDVRPGMIGEIGVAGGWITPLEERVHRAAARAQVRSGLPLATHTVSREVGGRQLELFQEEGVDLSRVCIGHCDSQPYLDYCLSIIERGAYMAFDNLGLQMGDLEERIAGLVMELARRGHSDRVLLSHDVGQTAELRCFGGRGYTYLVETFLPRLRAAGASEDLITTLTVLNPRAFLSVS